MIRSVSKSSDAKGLTPREIVAELDKYVIGQDEAKRRVAIALRNRWRRKLLPGDIAEEILPKNIMLIGPTGVGKTEIARRLAALAGAPFVKIEATRYTEVGYVGRDVEAMVRDLVEISVGMVKAEEMKRVQKRADERAEERILDLLLPSRPPSTEEEPDAEERWKESREKMRAKFRGGELDDREVEISVEERQTPFFQMFSQQGFEELSMDLPGALGNMFPTKQRTRRVKVPEAKIILSTQEAEKLLDREKVTREGMRRAEEVGIVFIDEIDKVVATKGGSGPDVSREGVQRDLLPLVEGTTCVTRYGPVKTNHILFVAAGAFSFTKPSDLVPELQGRFPLRAELKGLKREDLVRILTEPKNALVRQYTALLETEGIRITFRKDAIAEMAVVAAEMNSSMQDIGARRLQTVIERVLEEVSFEAPEMRGAKVSVDAKYVRGRLKDVLEDEDLRRYIL
ncbi:MAG: ATP-dependent protease ATPase subunit HslU [Planctomycetota bacterium]|jgi:ATP-dependent HslUV protease ATP-binding subunit HslU